MVIDTFLLDGTMDESLLTNSSQGQAVFFALWNAWVFHDAQAQET